MSAPSNLPTEQKPLTTASSRLLWLVGLSPFVPLISTLLLAYVWRDRAVDTAAVFAIRFTMGSLLASAMGGLLVAVVTKNGRWLLVVVACLVVFVLHFVIGVGMTAGPG